MKYYSSAPKLAILEFTSQETRQKLQKLQNKFKLCSDLNEIKKFVREHHINVHEKIMFNSLEDKSIITKTMLECLLELSYALQLKNKIIPIIAQNSVTSSFIGRGITDSSIAEQKENIKKILEKTMILLSLGLDVGTKVDGLPILDVFAQLEASDEQIDRLIKEFKADQFSGHQLINDKRTEPTSLTLARRR